MVYAARALRKAPGFALAAIALLAVGIGGTAVVFSLADALLFRPLALPRPAEIVRMVSVLPGRPSVSYYPYAYFEEWRARTRTLSATFAEADVDASLMEGAGSRLVRVGIVSADYFTRAPAQRRRWAACRAAAMSGRPGANCPPCSATSSGRLISRRPGALGQVLRLNGQPLRLAGVLPRGVNGTAWKAVRQFACPDRRPSISGAGDDPKGWGRG